MCDAIEIDVVIPTLNAGETLAPTLLSLAGARDAGLIKSTIISDGGSTDRTVEVAKAWGAHVEGSEKGRGQQLAVGAAVAESPWILFLHADTRLTSGWEQAARTFMTMGNSLDKAAVFSFALDDTSFAARGLERLVRWRCQLAALPYGDQGLLISRSLYNALGGYRSIPLMEDVDIVRRIGRHRLVVLTAKASTSADRYRRDGYVLRGVRNLFCLALYFCGVAPATIARLYR